MAMLSHPVSAPTTRGLPGKKQSLPKLIERESQRKRRRWLLLAASLLGVVAIAFSSWAMLRPKPAAIEARFRAATVTRTDVLREVNATGRLEALTTVQVGAEISGRIATVEVDYNDRVQTGQVLARFDRAALEAQAAQMQAALAASRASVAQARTDRERSARDKERVDRLFASRSISEAEHDTMNATARLME